VKQAFIAYTEARERIGERKQAILRFLRNWAKEKGVRTKDFPAFADEVQSFIETDLAVRELGRRARELLTDADRDELRRLAESAPVEPVSNREFVRSVLYPVTFERAAAFEKARADPVYGPRPKHWKKTRPKARRKRN
jgi:hypothetical protein